MDAVPEHRALLGVDVVGSGGLAGYHLSAVPEAVNTLVDRAFVKIGLDPVGDVLHREHTGDGAWLTVSSTCVGALMEAAYALDELARERNRWRKPDILLRLAIEEGPVGAPGGFYHPKIVLARLLDGSAFKGLFARCATEKPDTVATGLVISGRVKDDVFGGNYTSSAVRSDQFVELTVEHKEFRSSAWAYIPGFDTASLARLAETRPEVPESKDATEARNQVVANNVGRDMWTVQTDQVHGGVTFGRHG